MGRIFLIFCLLSCLSSSLYSLNEKVSISVEASETKDAEKHERFSPSIAAKKSLQATLHFIERIPFLKADAMPLTEVVEELNGQLQVPIVVGVDGTGNETSFTCILSNVPVGVILEFASENRGLNLDFQPDAILIFPTTVGADKSSPPPGESHGDSIDRRILGREANEQRIVRNAEIRNATLTEVIDSISQNPHLPSAMFTKKGREVAAKEARISLSLTNISAKDFLHRIAKEFGLQFYMGERVVIFDALPPMKK